MSTLRCFIGISMSEEIKNNLFRCREKIIASLGNNVFRWVKPENIHLTLHFLGNIPRETIPHLEKSLVFCCRTLSPFVVTLDGIGAFPSLKKPKVLWADLKNAGGELLTLHTLCGTILQNLGIEVDRRVYRPHLTIAYLKKRTSEDVMRYLDVNPGLLKNQISCKVKNLIIYESNLTPQGPVYTPIAVLSFGPA